MIGTNLKNLKLNLFDEGIFVKFTPNTDEEQKCLQYGKSFAKALLSQKN
jgi:flavorubredoxin